MYVQYTEVTVHKQCCSDQHRGVLSRELGPRGIRVNAVNPGLIETEGTHATGAMDSDFKTWNEGLTPLGRIGQVQDIAPIVSFLASDEARWITGEIILGIVSPGVLLAGSPMPSFGVSLGLRAANASRPPTMQIGFTPARRISHVSRNRPLHAATYPRQARIQCEINWSVGERQVPHVIAGRHRFRQRHAPSGVSVRRRRHRVCERARHDPSDFQKRQFRRKKIINHPNITKS